MVSVIKDHLGAMSAEETAGFEFPLQKTSQNWALNVDRIVHCFS
jgi:hypothetical protein